MRKSLPTIALAFVLAIGIVATAPKTTRALDSKALTDKATKPLARPDLILSSFSRASGGACASGQPLLILNVVVKNNGTAPAPMTPVSVTDLHGGLPFGPMLMPALQPSQQTVVRFHLMYSAQNEAHVRSAPVHTFRAIVDPVGTVTELNENNNSAVLAVPSVTICQ